MVGQLEGFDYQLRGNFPQLRAQPARQAQPAPITIPAAASSSSAWITAQVTPPFPSLLSSGSQLMIDSGEAVYGGMIIGEHTRDNDLEVNPLKSKQLTNFRASGKDDAIVLSPPVKLTLERAISYIQDDELVEITPNVIRLRKKYLDMHERKRQSRKSSVA